MIKHSRLLFFFLLLVLAAPEFGNSQGTNNPISKISISSPTAAALGKFGDIPVSYHTGIPQISVPIYTITTGPLSLPINLSYHASGLKVQEPASWVGAGWSLNAGGVITRSVMGAPDEKGTNNGATQSHGHFSDYGYNSYAYYNSLPDWQNFANGFKDGEPDLYFFNFNGISGKFYFRDDRTPVIVPEADLKIEPYYTGSNSIQAFTITTPDGIKYYFGNSPGLSGTAPIEITKPVTSGNGMSTANTISSWYLNKISSADDQFSISLSYTSESYGYYTLSMFPIDGVVTQGASGVPFGASHGYDLIKNIVQGVRLSQITFPNGSVSFIANSAARTDLCDDGGSLITELSNANAKALASIQVLSGTTVLKKFNFSYNYFTDNTTPLPAEISNFAPGLQTDRQRLKLEQVQETAGDNSISIPPYVFSYFTEQVPRRLCFALDHWGYNNGITANSSPIPTYTIYGSNLTTTHPGADRNSYWPAMRAGSLEKITYPTGGYSLFEFEPNSTYSTSTTNSNVTLLGQIVHLYGQSAVTTTGSFTTNGSAMNISFNNSSNYSASYTIVNSSNVTVYSTFIGNGQTSPTNALTLPPGTYQATLSLPNFGNLTLGCTADITQWQQVQTTSTITVGGNRIKTITHNDAVTANDIVTNYSYNGDNGYSSGVVYSKPVYVGLVRNDILKDVGMWTTSGFQQYMSVNGCLTVPDASYFKSPSSIRPMATTQGSHIGYSQVKVFQTGNGYSIYKYYGSSGVPPWMANAGDVSINTVNIQGCDANAPSFPYAPVPFDYMRGELQYESHYNQAGQKLKETSYTPTYVGSNIVTPCFIANYNSWGGGTWTLGTRYDLTTSKKTQTQTVETVYDNVGQALTTTKNNYNESPFHNEVTRTSVTNSKGETIESKNKYAFDFRLSTCDGIADGYSQYTSACSSCLTTYNSARTSCGGASQCLTDAYLNYLQCLSTARTNYVAYRKTNFTDPANTFKTYHDNAKASADAELKPILELQDNYQNALVESSSWKNSYLLGAAFTRYDYVSSPSGKVYPNKLQSISLSTPSSGFTGASTNGSNSSIVKDNRYADESTGKMENGNLVEITGKDGLTTSYIWGYNNTLPIVKATGVSYATLLSAYNSVSGNLATLRSQSSLASALISTYTYTPVIGMTSETDQRGRSVYYEYDNLTRLVLIRDNDNNIVKKICYNYQGQPDNCGTVTHYNAVRSGNFSKNNCPEGATPATVTYTVAAGTYSSLVSQAVADLLAQSDVNNNGQAFANSNGTCTFYSVQKSGNFTKNNCPAGGAPNTVTYTVAVGTYNSTVSQADADQLAQNDVDNNGQTYANNNGTCTFYSVQKSGNFTKNNCPAGGTPGTVSYTVAAGTYNSTTSQAAADQLAQNDVNNNGQTYANNNGACTFYSVQKSGNFTRNNCATGGTPGTVTYTVTAGSYNSTVSQTAADQLAQNNVDNNGQAYANSNGTCTFYNVLKSGNFTRNNCSGGSTGSVVTYTVPAGQYNSIVSQAAADQMAQNDVNANGQNYANSNGSCSAPNFSLDYVNYTGETQYITLTNTTTYESYYFSVDPNSSGNLGYIPEGNYDVQIWDPPYAYNSYQLACYINTAGYGCTVYSVPFDVSCHYIVISPNW